MYYEDNDSIGVAILKIIGTLILICILTFGARGCSRSNKNMIYIEDCYCYDRETHIIYIESISSRYGMETTYTPYYNTEGNLCKYNVLTDEWIPIEGD